MATPSTPATEFELTATGRLAVHQTLRSDSFNQHGTTVSAELEQIERPPPPMISEDMPATQSSLASSYRNHIHVAIMFLITTLGGYVQVVYQFKEKSSFDDHFRAPIMAAILVNLCLYAACMIAEFALHSEEPYVSIIETLGPLFGFLVCALILIILDPLVGAVASIIWVLFVLKAATTSSAMVVRFLRQVFSGMRSRFVSEESHCPELPV